METSSKIFRSFYRAQRPLIYSTVDYLLYCSTSQSFFNNCDNLRMIRAFLSRVFHACAVFLLCRWPFLFRVGNEICGTTNSVNRKRTTLNLMIWNAQAVGKKRLLFNNSYMKYKPSWPFPSKRLALLD